MADLPEHPTCTIRSGERVQIKRHHFVMPDGSKRASVAECNWETGAAFYVAYAEHKPPPRAKPKHRKPPKAMPPPLDVTPDSVADGSDATSAVALPPEPPKLPPEAATNVLTPVLIVAAVGAAGALGLRGFRASSATKTRADIQQQQDRERKRKECATRSDDALASFRTEAETMSRQQLPTIAEPDAFWQRCDALDAMLDANQRALRARAKTARA